MPRETGARVAPRFMGWRGVRAETLLPGPSVGLRNGAEPSGMPEGEPVMPGPGLTSNAGA